MQHLTSPEGGTAAASPAQLQQLVDSVESVIYGKREAVTLAVVGLLAEGHVLLEDVPGTGKTTLARALARSINAEFRRVQFTSDLLPSDVIGVSVYSSSAEGFRFQPGPIFSNIVLADELNRTTPRTQSSLLECMSEGRISVDGVTTQLPRPFMVIATQNPIAFEGTYPLPESQLDRFLLRIRMGYPERDQERRVLTNHRQAGALEALEPVLSLEDTLALVRRAHEVRIAEELVEYCLDLLAETRRTDRLVLGASPRAGLALLRAAQALALVEGRDYCVPDDIKQLVVPVLAHRVVAAPFDGAREPDPDVILAELAETVPVPQ